MGVVDKLSQLLVNDYSVIHLQKMTVNVNVDDDMAALEYNSILIQRNIILPFLACRIERQVERFTVELPVQ